jgi:hypothetical protein
MKPTAEIVGAKMENGNETGGISSGMPSSEYNMMKKVGKKMKKGPKV